MKREEAVEIIKKWLMEGIYGLTRDRLGYIEGWFYKEDAEAFKMAIKALEQEPVLDKIREEKIVEIIHGLEFTILNKIIAEIRQEIEAEQCTGSIMAYDNVIRLINKYRTERDE